MTGVFGDERLATQLRMLMGAKHPVVAVATVSPHGTTVASVGAGQDADFEIGSISKGVTGLLYADAIERGEVTPATVLGDLLPLGHSQASRVTLASLSTHTSGLPRLPASAAPVRRTFALWLRGRNPYTESVEQRLIQARGVEIGSPEVRYSNLGYELFGHALARAAGTDYRTLVRTRIAEPLGLDVFYIPSTPAELRPEALLGTSRSRRPREPWAGEALGPAGGIRATIGDMARLATALLDGSAPGIAALDPVTEIRPNVHIGAAWITLDHRGRRITWHNGGTGGFRSWFGLDRDAKTAVALLSATAISVDEHGLALLTQTSETVDR